MGKSFKNYSNKVIKGIIIFLSSYFILCYLYVVSKRLLYPFELEWLEGYFLVGIARILKNESIYPPPNAEFIPFLYPPLYYWIVAGLAKITGVNFGIARLVSILSSLLSGFIIYQFIRRETKSNFCAFFASGLFFASYEITGSWFDIARVDSLFVALALSGIYLLRYFSHSYHGLFFASLMLSLSFFTKQSAVFFILGCSVYLWFIQRKKCLFFTLVSLVIIAAASFLFNFLTDGWYWFHTFKVPLHHYSYRRITYDPSLKMIFGQYEPTQVNYASIRKVIDFFKVDLFKNIPVILIFILGWILYEIRTYRRQPASLFWPLVLLSALISSISMRSKYGGYINALIPSVSVSLILYGIIAGRILNKRGNESMFRIFLRFLLYIATVLQFALMAYNPVTQLSTRDDYQAGRNLLQTISSFKGDVYLPFHSYYSVMAGKKMYAHKMPIEDIYVGFPQLLPQDLFNKIKQKEFSAIIYDWEIKPETQNPLEKAILQAYPFSKQIPYRSEKTFLPLAGAPFRPRFIFLPAR